MGFNATFIYRPAALLGNRNESRMGEKIGIGLSKVLSPLFLCPLKKYKPIEAEVVANVMLKQAKQSLQGFHIFESSEIQKMADSI
ncbi:MAG: hypothetical protein GW809_03720 [Bacteroidetes bacterium]|nr:hypothetical protein [Bacteroidota bacterium]